MNQVGQLPLRYCVPGMKVGERVASGNDVIARKGETLDDALICCMEKNDVGFVPILLTRDSQEVYDDFRVNKLCEQSLAEYELGYKKLKRELKRAFLSRSFSNARLRGIASTLLDRASGVGKEGIFACVDGIRDVDEYLYTHSLNVALLACQISAWVGIKGEDRLALVYAGLVHDIGKTRIDPKIISKPGAYDAEEMRIVKKHPQLGDEILRKVEGLAPSVREAVLSHHEKINGSGYPRALRGDDIHWHARILAICDIYDAMMADKVYSTRQSSFHVFDVFMSDRMNGNLDYELVNMFLNQISSAFVGRGVTLEDGRVGRIIHMNPKDYSRPMVQIGNIILDTAAANIGIVDVFAS